MSLFEVWELHYLAVAVACASVATCPRGFHRRMVGRMSKFGRAVVGMSSMLALSLSTFIVRHGQAHKSGLSAV